MNKKVIPLLITFVISLILLASVLQAPEKEKGSEDNGYIELIRLPEPVYSGKISIEEAIKRRRSIRDYKNEALSLNEISQLLWAAQGITNRGRGFRSAPSAGATYPLEIYIVVGNVKDLEQGIYHYIPEGHQIELLYLGDYRKELQEASLNQEWVGNAPVDIVFTAIYSRTTARYGDRGIRYVHLETGHAAENVYLQAVSLNLGTVVVGAFDDRQIKEILNLTSEEPVYIMPVGRI